MSGDRPPPRRVFLSHTAELRKFPTARSHVAAAEAAVARAGDAVTDLAYFPGAGRAAGSGSRDAVEASDVSVPIARFVGVSKLVGRQAWSSSPTGTGTTNSWEPRRSSRRRPFCAAKRSTTSVQLGQRRTRAGVSA